MAGSGVVIETYPMLSLPHPPSCNNALELHQFQRLATIEQHGYENPQPLREYKICDRFITILEYLAN